MAKVRNDVPASTASESAMPEPKASGNLVGQRSIRPFRPLPSGRAVIGGLLITLAAFGAFMVTGREVEDVRIPYLVASADLAPGHVLAAEDLEPLLLDLPTELAASSTRETASGELVGAVVLGPVSAGELIQRSSLTLPDVANQDPAAIVFSFSVPESRVPRSLRPGELVAMLSTTGRDDAAVTRVVVAEAVVTDVEASEEGFGTSSDVIVTIAIDGTEEVLQAVNAAQATDVTMLRIPADGRLTLPKSSVTDPGLLDVGVSDDS